MNTERVIAWLALLISVYGAVFFIRSDDLTWAALFTFCFVGSIWTVLALTDQPEFGERE